MTQIKLRRDTSVSFTSKNPVLGVGEPAYETDTKKLKIGDGTTAYTQLEYFSSGGGGSTNITATLPLKIVDGVIFLDVDGQTIQIVDGKLHANLDELGNEVNTLAGEVASVQADLTKKQNKLTAGSNITISADNIISTTGLLSSEKRGLEGDYCSRYGIVDCPNGIIEEGAGQVTLKAGVVMQMTETDGLTTNASDMPHTITSTVDFDLFYTSSNLLEATQVVFSEQEPDNGATGAIAWYNGTKWQFKSNDEGNVWRAAPAVRLAHCHITDGNITRIDYIGNRHLNKVIPVTTDAEQTITGKKTFTENLLFDCTSSTSNTLGINAKYLTGGQVQTSVVFGGQLGANNNLNFGLDNALLRITGNPIQFSQIPINIYDGTKFLTQSTVTGTDNVTVTETADGIQVAGLSNSAIAALSGITNNVTIYNNVVAGAEYSITEAGYWTAMGDALGLAYISIDLKDAAGNWSTITGINSPQAGMYITTPICFFAAGEEIRVRHGNMANMLLLCYKPKGGAQ